MTDLQTLVPYGDALTREFWQAAVRHELLVQYCADCGRYQFYPRPFCLSCGGDRVKWVPACGHARIYSQTTVHLPVVPSLAPPYVVAIVTLEEGPRLMTRIVGPPCRIGDRVRIEWIPREDLPPLPVFRGDP